MDAELRRLRRSATFTPAREPLQDDQSLKLMSSRTFGPVSFLNPTKAQFGHQETGKEPVKEHGSLKVAEHDRPADKVEFRWTSRNNRKGRHQLDIMPAQVPGTAKYYVPEPTNSPREILKNIGRMFTKYPFFDVSWLVAYIFSLGSIVWVINSFFVFLPFIRPESEFENEILYGGGITAFIGATIFEVGSILLMLEAVNENRTGCFGWAVERVISDATKNHGGPFLRLVPNQGTCKHHHRNRLNLVGLSAKPSPASDEEKGEIRPLERRNSVAPGSSKSWTWFPSKYELRTHYFHELGFLACCSQLIGASIFWISGFTALPGILNKLSDVVENVIFWLPQVLGGTGFIISGTLFMVETQEKWYKPAPSVLGWHVGLWNLIGGVGFTLCPAFGFNRAHWAQYQASCSTFWGSWAFLIGSVVQLYESLQKHPVDVEKPAARSMSGSTASVMKEGVEMNGASGTEQQAS